MTIAILSVLPERLNVNGDAENARVLAMRAKWHGFDAAVVTQVSGLPHAVVIGSGFDSDLAEALDAMRAYAPMLRECVAAGIPILAVGTGFEMLCGHIQLSDTERFEGLGILPGRVFPAQDRLQGDVVAESRFGVLVGYENHARAYELPEGERELGRVVCGHGNGETSGGRTEGVIFATTFGTHLHGPILAKNPAFADHLLSLAIPDFHSEDNEGTEAVDLLANEARKQIFKRTSLPDYANASHIK
jgi:CobQ-like glutamine amidotransferase family enzyme